MAKENYAAYATGKDAAYIKPKLIPDYELLARDDSGGPDYDGYTAEFGDGGYVIGEDEKSHISAKKDGEHAERLDEESEDPRTEGYRKVAGSRKASPERIPASSTKYSKE